jgi:replicative DNA helicase
MDKYKAVAKRRTTIIGAKTSIGKSILASNIVTAMLKDGSRVLLFTPELDKQEYTDRIICAEANVPIDAWKLGAIEGIHAKRIAEANQRLLPNAGNLFIEDRGSQSAGFILNSVKKHLLNHQVDVVVVDYLQKLHYYGEAKKAITEMMDKFCAFAKDNNIAFILVSQLRRGEETEPTINMLKESGDLENFADCVILLHRNSITAPREKNKGWYMIAKNRQGPVTDRVEINFKDDCLKFEEVGQQTVTIDEDENDESGGFGGRK